MLRAVAQVSSSTLLRPLPISPYLLKPTPSAERPSHIWAVLGGLGLRAHQGLPTHPARKRRWTWPWMQDGNWRRSRAAAAQGGAEQEEGGARLTHAQRRRVTAGSVMMLRARAAWPGRHSPVPTPPCPQATGLSSQLGHRRSRIWAPFQGHAGHQVEARSWRRWPPTPPLQTGRPHAPSLSSKQCNSLQGATLLPAGAGSGAWTGSGTRQQANTRRALCARSSVRCVCTCACMCTWAGRVCNVAAGMNVWLWYECVA